MAGNKKPGRRYVPLSQKRAVALTEKNKKLDGTYVDHREYVKLYRTRITKVMRDIEAGSVSAEDLAKMRNFIQHALAAMERMSMADIDKAWFNAEAMSIVHHDMGVAVVEPDVTDQYAVVYDPDLHTQEQDDEHPDH